MNDHVERWLNKAGTACYGNSSKKYDKRYTHHRIRIGVVALLFVKTKDEKLIKMRLHWDSDKWRDYMGTRVFLLQLQSLAIYLILFAHGASDEQQNHFQPVESIVNANKDNTLIFVWILSLPFMTFTFHLLTRKLSSRAALAIANGSMRSHPPVSASYSYWWR